MRVERTRSLNLSTITNHVMTTRIIYHVNGSTLTNLTNNVSITVNTHQPHRGRRLSLTTRTHTGRQTRRLSVTGNLNVQHRMNEGMSRTVGLMNLIRILRRLIPE